MYRKLPVIAQNMDYTKYQTKPGTFNSQEHMALRYKFTFGTFYLRNSPFAHFPIPTFPKSRFRKLITQANQ